MNTDGRRRIKLMPYINTVCLRTYPIHLWRIARVIHLNNCLSKTRTHTVTCARREEGKCGVSKKREARERERGGGENGDHKSSFYWSIGYCFTDLLAQQCCECNHIAVIKHIPACWHFLKASLSYFPLIEELAGLSDSESVLNTWSFDTHSIVWEGEWDFSCTNMCTMSV